MTEGRSGQSVVGLVVNPIAGVGGRVGLKGTDGAATLRRAVELGAEPLAPARVARALGRLAPAAARLELLAAPGPMGASLAASAGLSAKVVGAPPASRATSAADTRAAVAAMAGRVDLLLFAGGDGTARDVLAASGGKVPVLGVPVGVKMHSGVFASSPEAAGEVALSFLAEPPGDERVVAAEVVDVDEIPEDGPAPAPRLYGTMPVPAGRRGVLATKSSSRAADEQALDALCREIAAELEEERTCVLGPGTTTARIARHLGVEGTLLGVDVVRGGELVGADLGERELLRALAGAVEPRLFVGVIGGQGSLFGRGNQQLSPAVLRRIGPRGIVVVCAAEKLAALLPARLCVDTGDPALDRQLRGHRRVRVAPGREMMIEVSG